MLSHFYSKTVFYVLLSVLEKIWYNHLFLSSLSVWFPWDMYLNKQIIMWFINRVMLSAGISSACHILHLHSHCNSRLHQMPTGREILSLRSELVKISKIPFLHLYLKMRRAEAHTVSKESLTYFDTAIRCFVFGSLHSNTRRLESRQSPRSTGINAAASTRWVDVLKCWEDHDKISKYFCTITSNKDRAVI